jgi:hypothetical protein
LPAAKAVAVRAMDYARPPVQHPRYAEIMDILKTELLNAQLGRATVRDALARAVPQVNRVLARQIDRP